MVIKRDREVKVMWEDLCLNCKESYYKPEIAAVLCKDLRNKGEKLKGSTKHSPIKLCCFEDCPLIKNSFGTKEKNKFDYKLDEEEIKQYRELLNLLESIWYDNNDELMMLHTNLNGIRSGQIGALLMLLTKCIFEET